MRKFISKHENPEKFNDKLIFMKRDDDVLVYVKDICSALEVVEGIKFLGASIERDESKFKTRSYKINKNSKKEEDDEYQKWQPIEISRLDRIKMKFELNDGVEKDVIEKEILYPKLVDDFFFMLNSNRYFPMYQIIDIATYHTSKSLTLKTLLMPIIIRFNNTTIEDNDGNSYSGKSLILNVFKNKINFLYYYLSNFGFKETLEYFGLDEDKFYLYNSEEEQVEYDKNEYVQFNFNNKLSALVDKEVLKTDYHLNFVISFSDMINSRVKLENVNSTEYWKKKMGMFFTKNTTAQVDKAEKVIVSFNRIMDNRTKSILRLPEEDKRDTFSIVRWMIKNHDTLTSKDNMDLSGKRLRLHEYLLHPLLIRYSSDTYRLLNQKSPLTLKTMKSMFNTIGPGFIIKKLTQSNKSSASNSSLMRYYNIVNEMHLFSSALKVSFRGPQSLTEGIGNVSTKYRGLNPSYAGRLGLTSASASDPGLTSVLVPFIETDELYFVKKESELE